MLVIRVLGLSVVVAYAGKASMPNEANWSTIEREAYAVVWSIKYFRHYLYGRLFELAYKSLN